MRVFADTSVILAFLAGQDDRALEMVEKGRDARSLVISAPGG